MINQRLAKKQGLSPEDIKELEILYKKLEDVLNEPQKYKYPMQEIQDIEYTLQELWKFPKDKKFHKYWNLIYGCTCPHLDNLDALGTGRIYINGDCKWHGGW